MAQNKFAFSIPDLAVKKLLLQEESSIFKKAICMSSSRCFPWWLQSCWWNSLLEEFFLLRHLVSLLVLKLPLIKAAKCTFSDWKRYINLVFAKWECQFDSFQMSCLTIVLGVSHTHHVSNKEVYDRTWTIPLSQSV